MVPYLPVCLLSSRNLNEISGAAVNLTCARRMQGRRPYTLGSRPAEANRQLGQNTPKPTLWLRDIILKAGSSVTDSPDPLRVRSRSPSVKIVIPCLACIPDLKIVTGSCVIRSLRPRTVLSVWRFPLVAAKFR